MRRSMSLCKSRVIRGAMQMSMERKKVMKSQRRGKEMDLRKKTSFVAVSGPKVG
jgi:hypothetical protein